MLLWEQIDCSVFHDVDIINADYKQAKAVHLWQINDHQEFVVVLIWQDPKRITLFEFTTAASLKDSKGKSMWTVCPVSTTVPAEGYFNICAYDFQEENIFDLHKRASKFVKINSLHGGTTSMRKKNIYKFLIEYTRNNKVDHLHSSKQFAYTFYNTLVNKDHFTYGCASL